MRMRGLAVLAVLAALLGAPSIASGGGTAQGQPQAEMSNELLGPVLIVGLSGIAAVAIIGTALLVIGRRRPDGPRAAGAPDSSSPAGDIEPLLQRRIARRATIRLDDDPIVAAMGVDNHVDARRRRRGPRPPAGEPAPRRDG